MSLSQELFLRLGVSIDITAGPDNAQGFREGGCECDSVGEGLHLLFGPQQHGWNCTTAHLIPDRGCMRGGL